MARSPETELLGAEDVAGLMGVKESTVWRWCREGTLPCLKVGKALERQAGGFGGLPQAEEAFRYACRTVELLLTVPDTVLVDAQDLHSCCTAWTPPYSGSARRGAGRC